MISSNIRSYTNLSYIEQPGALLWTAAKDIVEPYITDMAHIDIHGAVFDTMAIVCHSVDNNIHLQLGESHDDY